MRASGWVVFITLALTLSACLRTAAPSPNTSLKTLTSAPELMQIDIQRGWVFKADPSGTADWSAPSVDDGSWDVLDAGDFWQNQGYDGYAGVAWYRRSVDVPATWAGRQAHLILGGVNDEFQVYVGGQPQAQGGSLEPGKSAILHATDTPVQLTPGKPNLIAIKVTSAHNFGGLAKGPVMLSTRGEVAASPQDVATAYASSHPGGLWPNWLRGQGRNWTVTGLPDGGPESLAGPDGGWEPTATAPSVTAWLTEKGALLRPLEVNWSLAEGHLPIVQTSWQDDQITVATQLWQDASGAQWLLKVQNQGPARDMSVWVAIRPYQVQPGIAPIYDVSMANVQRVIVNGQPALVAAVAPSRVAASTGEQGDLSVLASAGITPDFEAAQDGAGLAELALVYDVHLSQGQQRSFSFAAPVRPGPQPKPSGDPSSTASRWRELLQPDSIQVPDSRVTDAFYASLAYMLISRDGGSLHPGPLLHDAFWYRDSAYMLTALERGGQLSTVRSLLPTLVRFQSADGELPANVSTHRQVGHRRGAPEWDAQGEGIHALVEYYRFARDQAWLKAQWPAIDRGASWLERLIGPDGLLPPGASAEDLGSPQQQHFWDDFWAVIGLRDASYAAGLVGDSARAATLTTAADALLRATMAAGQVGVSQQGTFPNGPGAYGTPADARGSSPAVWPGQLWPAEFARAQFEGYFQRWVQPFGGAFRHEANNFWPFGGLEIAHASLLAGLPEQTREILAWQLNHPTGKGVWAWGDQVSETGSQLLVGDMPHGWVAAEYVSLVRDMLLYESGDRLRIATGAGQDWLSDGQSVAVKALPTYFGPVSYQLRRSGSTVTLDLQAVPPPPDGYELYLPFQVVAVDGQPASGQPVHLPPGTTHVSVVIA